MVLLRPAYVSSPSTAHGRGPDCTCSSLLLERLSRALELASGLGPHLLCVARGIIKVHTDHHNTITLSCGEFQLSILRASDVTLMLLKMGVHKEYLCDWTLELVKPIIESLLSHG